MDSKLITYLEKTGQGELAKILQNSPEKFPDEFDPEKTAGDYLESRNAIFKSSEDFKNALKEQRIIAEKEVNKFYNDELNLGLTKDEAAKLGRSEIAKIVKDKHELQINESKNGHTKEWQDKHAQAIAESTKLKKMLEDTETTYKKQLEEANSKYETRVKEENISKVFNEFLDKQDWGNDEGAKTRKEVGKVYLQAKIKESQIKWDEKGAAFKGENDVVTTPDGVTRLNDLDAVMKFYGKEAALFAQANSGGTPPKTSGQTTTATSSGDPALDRFLAEQVERNTKLNAHILSK